MALSGRWAGTLTSRWFPLVFGLLQTMRHIGLIAANYAFIAVRESHFNVWCR